ncbi:hypothetical protein [Aerococcus viridans]|uniref:hypothetical protein n=1 Tax=Aerococcus viridans TaxID=1377 RepID=UPI00223C2A29|nr:hypothetical protein [Aerococcus viridans]MCT1798487.1 hypothetical protein [Aerococcus viridans]
MNITLTGTQTRFYLGAPQHEKIQVYQVPTGRAASLTQAIVTNTTDGDAKFTLTVNTVDVLRDYIITAGESKILDLYVVLKDGDVVSLSQETANALNVTLNGVVA